MIRTRSCQDVPGLLLGNKPRPIKVYASFGMDATARAAENAATAVASGFRAVTVKIGYDTTDEDLAVIRSIRRAVGRDVDLMVDYNQCLTAPNALRRCRTLDDEGLAWIEEPVRCDNLDGHARIARVDRSPDKTRPSAHLMALSPAPHLHGVLQTRRSCAGKPLQTNDGYLTATDEPGNGIIWDEAAVERFTVAMVIRATSSGSVGHLTMAHPELWSTQLKEFIDGLNIR
jgi:L-alanine-DL-glutamate epimerase-like enolase superfamily enzyme